MDRIDAPGRYRIVPGDDGQPVAELLDDGSSHPLPAEGHPVVLVRSDGERLIAYQRSGAALKLPGGQAVASGVETEVV